MFIDARSEEKLAMARSFEYVGVQWNSMTPRERVLLYHISNSPTAYKTWSEMTTSENWTVMEAAIRLKLHQPPVAEGYSFSAAEKDKIETKK
jgi:hypothetical protein